MKGKHHSKKSKLKMSIAHNGEKWSSAKRRKIEKAPCRHHLDANRENNVTANILVLTRNSHRKLHCRSYDFLVHKGLIDEYIKWFTNKYGLN